MISIPLITDPLGRSWDQPDISEIELDDTHALMSERTRNKLSEYSMTIPTGVYEGKMWKRRTPPDTNEPGIWDLMWFGPSEKEGCCDINVREILIA